MSPMMPDAGGNDKFLKPANLRKSIPLRTFGRLFRPVGQLVRVDAQNRGTQGE